MSKLYLVTLKRGGCGIREAQRLSSARKNLEKEVGIFNIEEVREATERDVAWVRGMGGHIPTGKFKLKP